MYQHLLVPIDGSPLSQALVEHAVLLARRIDARICFFHARSDFGASSDGAVLHALAPASFERAAAGNARALLAKAEAAARAANVPCRSLSVISDHPAEAITAAVHKEGSDAIVIASHGRRGFKGALLGSVTQKVLQAATVPVVVAAVESNLAHSEAQEALSIIKDEHRSLAAIIHGLQLAIGKIEEASNSDVGLLRAMLFYIEQFPERLHHPKEESFLFRLLRLRTSEYDGVLAELEQQHHEGSVLFVELRKALQAFESGGAGTVAVFRSALEHFAKAQWHHMTVEEQVILPAAISHLTDADWHEVSQAFKSNNDPHFAMQDDGVFNELLVRILNMTP